MTDSHSDFRKRVAALEKRVGEVINMPDLGPSHPSFVIPLIEAKADLIRARIRYNKVIKRIDDELLGSQKDNK